MKKIQFSVVVLIALLVCTVSGCGRKDYNGMVENHAAIKAYRDGVWDVRYFSGNTSVSSESVESVVVRLSVDVNKDMAKEQMMEVMDYYEFTRNALFEKGEYKGEQDAEYTCYAVFYRGDTDEEVCRIKYHNGEETEAAEEEKPMFPMPGLRTDKVVENP